MRGKKTSKQRFDRTLKSEWFKSVNKKIDLKKKKKNDKYILFSL